MLPINVQISAAGMIVKLSFKVRMQCAKEFKDLLFAKIIEAIREGVQEQAAASNLADKTPAEILDQGDYVRQQVLTKFEEFDAEGRLPGTY